MRSASTGAFALCFVCFASSPPAADVTVECRLGFEGSLLEGSPMPLTMRITNDTSGDFEAQVRVLDSAQDWSVERGVAISTGSTRQISLLVPSSIGNSVVVELSSRDKHTFRAPITRTGEESKKDTRRFRIELPHSQRRVGAHRVLVLGARSRQIVGALPQTRGTQGLRVLESSVALVPLGEDWAPDSSLAYSAFSTILWTEPDLLRLPDPAQLRALFEWVQQGGRLVLLSAARPALLDVSELRAVLPTDAITPRLGAYPSPNTMPEALDGKMPLLDLSPRLEARLLPRAEGTWLGDLPPSLERRLGQGRVVVAGFDPLRYDLGQPAILAAALARASGLNLSYGVVVPEPRLSSLGSLGGAAFYELLANRNVMTPPLGLFIFLGILYVLLIGPLDYVLLRDRKRLHWSPWTLLGYTAVFTGSCLLATYLLFAKDEEINRIALLDFSQDLDGRECVHGTVYHGLYLPFGGDEVVDVPGYQVFGALTRPRDERAIVLSSSRQPDEGEQQWSGPGMQPLALSLPFNSLRVTAQQISGRTTGSVTASFVRTGRGYEFTVHNGLDSDLEHAVMGTQQGVAEIGRLRAGETRSLKLGAIGPLHEPEPLLDKPAILRRGVEPTLDFPEVRRTGAPELPLVGALQLGSVEQWCKVAERRPLEAPWTLRLDGDQALFMAVTDTLPFEDSLEHRPEGFTWVFVRTIVPLTIEEDDRP